MELAIAAISSLGSVAAGAGAAAVPVVGAAGAAAVPTFLAGAGASGIGAAAATGLSSLFSGLGSAASILSGGTSVLAAMRAYQAGNERGDELDARAADERLAGTQRRIELKREQLDVLGQNDVAAAAAGIDLSYGIAADARTRVVNEAAGEIDADRRAEDLRWRAYRRQARAARGTGALQSFLSLAEGGLSLAERYA